MLLKSQKALGRRKRKEKHKTQKEDKKSEVVMGGEGGEGGRLSEYYNTNNSYPLRAKNSWWGKICICRTRKFSILLGRV